MTSQWYLFSIFSVAGEIEHLFLCLLAIYNSSLENGLFILLALLLIGLLAFMMLRVCVYVCVCVPRY